MWVKKLRRKTLVEDVFDEWSVRSLVLLIFAVWRALRGKPQSEHESVMPLLSLSPLMFNQLKLCRLSGNIFRKWFASYFLISHEHLIIMWSQTVNLLWQYSAIWRETFYFWSNVTQFFGFFCKLQQIRTSNFWKVVRQTTEGMVGSIVWFPGNLVLFQAVKEFKNPLRSD